jgi:hypothetical protein
MSTQSQRACAMDPTASHGAPIATPSPWARTRAALVHPQGRALALRVALRHVHRARTRGEVVHAVEAILLEHVGVEEFVIVEPIGVRPAILAARGVDADTGQGAPPAELARLALGSGRYRLGVLVIRRLADGKAALDAFDEELFAALGPQIEVALHDVGERAVTGIEKTARGEAA